MVFCLIYGTSKIPHKMHSHDSPWDMEKHVIFWPLTMWFLAQNLLDLVISGWWTKSVLLMIYLANFPTIIRFLEEGADAAAIVKVFLYNLFCRILFLTGMILQYTKKPARLELQPVAVATFSGFCEASMLYQCCHTPAQYWPSSKYRISVIEVYDMKELAWLPTCYESSTHFNIPHSWRSAGYLASSTKSTPYNRFEVGQCHGFLLGLSSWLASGSYHPTRIQHINKHHRLEGMTAMFSEGSWPKQHIVSAS